MKAVLRLALGGFGLALVPLIAMLAGLGMAVSGIACLETAGGRIRDDAMVSEEERALVALTQKACPALPEPWIAAVMYQESGFNPDAHADDVNGGTWGLFQINESVWQGAYGGPWATDRDGDGTWDVRQAEIHARVGGEYLCDRLDGVRKIRSDHPDWASSELPLLDALIIAHNAGESRLASYPDIPQITQAYLVEIAQRVELWTDDDGPGASPEEGPGSVSEGPGTNGGPPDAPAACLPGLGIEGAVQVPTRTPPDVADAVRNAMAYVGVRSGWSQLCARLACRAYGYESAGYTSAATMWDAAVADVSARPRDRCPPLGSFTYWETGRPYGHVSMVVQADAGCDPTKTKLTTNASSTSATMVKGGVYLVDFASMDSWFLSGNGYLGWAWPQCLGERLPATASHPLTP